jgi:hypothetical protein
MTASKFALAKSSVVSVARVVNNTTVVVAAAAANESVEEDPLAPDDDMYMGLLQEREKLPPKLPKPIWSMHCGEVRQALCKVLWFHNGYQLPNYGNPETMPPWWPDDIMEWKKLRNLRHKYDGHLGNSYTNCLRIALQKGLEHYGVDPDTYHMGLPRVPGPGGPGPGRRYNEENIVVEPDHFYDSLEESLSSPAKKRGPPPLVNIKDFVKKSGYPKGLLAKPKWFPPRLSDANGIVAPSKVVLGTLKGCKVSMDRAEISRWDVRMQNSKTFRRDGNSLSDILWKGRDDGHADIHLISSDGRRLPAHRAVMAAACGPKSETRQMLRDMADDTDATMAFPDIDSETLMLLLKAMYYGVVSVNAVMRAKAMQGLGLLNKELKMLLYYQTTENTVTENIATAIEQPDDDQEGILVINDEEDSGSEDAEVDEEEEKKSPEKGGEDDKKKKEEKSSEDSNTAQRSQRLRTRSKRFIENDDNAALAGKKKKKKKRRKVENTPDFAIAAAGEWRQLQKTEGQLGFVRWLLEKRFLARAPKCKSCRDKLKLTKDDETADGASWSCPFAWSGTATEHSTSRSLRVGSIFEADALEKRSLAWILEVSLCWKEDMRYQDCAEATGASVADVVQWYDFCQQFFDNGDDAT